ncbi:hypothetical protein EDD17DRAFT_1761872 [Pisolithus thermaeus]|nr:hypothetical protein EDD17DRAFT_1761872 [Pisolithus thermaeus]
MMWQPQQGCAPVTIDTRALIDKVLARYSGEFTVFRELLQNSDDAECDAAEIRFKTTAFSDLDPGAATNPSSHVLPDLETTNVTDWIFRNYGKPFTPTDWSRLPRIASGNPDPRKVGAFGVGFYSLFSVTETPYVSSGGAEMKFSWDAKGQLFYEFGNYPEATPRDLWTTFKMPLREVAPMPPISDFMQFLASSITFMVHLKKVAVFFDHHRVGQINKSQGQSQVIPIPTELKRRSPEENMTVDSVQQYRKSFQHIVMLPQCDSVRTHEVKVDLVVFTADVDVAVNEKLLKELKRCMKKDPPSHLKYSLIYTGKDEYDQSCIGEQRHTPEFPSAFRGLRADLDGSIHTRVFIGHATAQTTGIGGHMASHFIPTVERESIDLVNGDVSIWNRELLYVGGFLCRMVYGLELSKIQRSWEEAVASEPHSPLSRALQDQHFLHLFKFFTFHHSTPSSKVAELLAKSFYGCSTFPLRLLSSVGVREAPEVRKFDPVFTKFLKSLPMLSKDVTQDCEHAIERLPGQHKIRAISPSDVLQDLRRHILDFDELLACLRWWIASRRDDLTPSAADLSDAVTFRGTGGAIPLSTITYFIDSKVLGLHIPPNGPLPLSLIPLRISMHFSYEELASFGWKEFTVASWLQHLSRPDVMSADEKYDFTQSADWASRVLSTLRHVWPKLPEDIRSESREVLRNKPCIPTSRGLCYPKSSYFPVADNVLFDHLGLPIVSPGSGFEVNEGMKEFLLFIGVQKNPPVQFLLHHMSSTGNWTVFNLIDYLVQEEPSLTSEDFSTLKLSKIFRNERSQGNEEENICYRIDGLYPPVDIFRRLRLPVIKWSGKSEWMDTSLEAQLLYRIGLNRFPPLPTIVDLCSSRDVGVQETAFEYLCNKLHLQYSHYNPEDFCNVEFIPAESKDRTCLRKLGEVYSGSQWKALGFFVVQDRYLSMPLHQLGVAQHPPTSELLDLLEKSPPLDQSTASQWFEVLFDHMETIDLTKLSGLPIVPTGPPSALKLLPPTQCHLDQGTIPVLYKDLFVFVKFGNKANQFLIACGLKNKVSTEDVAEVLIENPERFFDLAGGYDGYLVELRKLACQSQDISNDTLHKMSHSPALLGLRRKEMDGESKWDYEYQFLTYQGVTIVDDVYDYELFSDHLFIAPREEALERFYASLGCSCLSAVVKERCNDLREIPSAKTCPEVQSLILERLPLFMQNYSDTKPKVKIPSSPDHLKVKACKRILVSKTLATVNVERTKDVWTVARREGDRIELWISKTAKRDMYEVATSLCRLLFGTNTRNTTLLLGTMLSANSTFLERRGYLVDQIPQRRSDTLKTGTKTRKEHLTGSASTTNPPQKSTMNFQFDLQFSSVTPPGSPEATPQLPSLPCTANSDQLTIREGSSISVDKSLNTARLPRAPREVISLSDIREPLEPYHPSKYRDCSLEHNVEKAMQLPSSDFCTVPADIGCLRPVGHVRNVRVCIDEGVCDGGTFMKRMHDPLARFVDIIITLSEIYRIPTATLRVFYDVSGGCIAFNSRGIIYLNLRYFEVWHDKQVESGNQQDARMTWFLALAHEIAHNLIDRHNSDHEFWSSAICQAHLVAFSRLLRSANTRLRYMLWLGLIALVILSVYLTKRTTLVIDIPH